MGREGLIKGHLMSIECVNLEIGVDGFCIQWVNPRISLFKL